MGKLSNLINGFNHKNMVIVSDYAADLGAKYKKPTRAEVEEHRYLMTDEKNLAPKFRHGADGLQSVEYETVQGFAPNITLVDYGFKVQGGVMTYHDKYVMFPQRRVAQDLSEHLTALVQKNGNGVDEHVFSKIDHLFMHNYGDDAKNNIKQSFYYFQGNPYCLRIEKEKQCVDNLLDVYAETGKDVYHWYRFAPVAAHYQGDNIQCDDVLFADHVYNENKFVDDLRDSTILKTVPGAEQVWRKQAAAQAVQENEKSL